VGISEKPQHELKTWKKEREKPGGGRTRTRAALLPGEDGKKGAKKRRENISTNKIALVREMTPSGSTFETPGNSTGGPRELWGKKK